MPEENEKKINYKILTAEHLIEEKETESKETKISPEPSIEPEIIKKAEPVVSSQTIKENEIINKELEPIEINTKTESGVVHSPVEEVSLSPISFVEKPTFFSDSTNLTEQIPTVELKGLKPEPFTKEQPEELVSDVKPRFEIIKGESLVSNESSQSLSQETKVRKINFKPIIFITSSAIILIVGVFVLKPYERFKLIFSDRGDKKNATTSIAENLASKLPQLITTNEPIITITSTATVSSAANNNQQLLTTTSEKFSTSTIFESANTISQQTTVTTGSIFGTNTVSTNTVPISKTSTSTKPTSTLTKPTSTSTSTKSTLTSTKPTSTIVKISTNTDVTKSKTVIETSTTVNSRTSVTTTIPPSLILTSSKSTSSSVATSSSKLTSSPASTLSSKTTTKTAIKLISDNLTTSSSQVSFSTKTELTVAAETFMATSVPAEIITDFNAIERDLNLKALSLVEFENELNSFLAYQWAYGSLINLKIMVNNNPVPLDLIFSYFLRPTKIKSVEIENFKKNLSNKFAVLIFYGYSRKYPILIFEVKNPELAKNFNNQWMKNNMANDLQSLFLGKDPGKIISKFNLKKIDNFSYNIIYFQNNFQIGWSLVNNYLIYSASEAGLKEAINQLKK